MTDKEPWADRDDGEQGNPYGDIPENPLRMLAWAAGGIVTVLAVGVVGWHLLGGK